MQHDNSRRETLPVQKKASAVEYHYRTVPVHTVSAQNITSAIKYQQRRDAMQYNISTDNTEVKNIINTEKNECNTESVPKSTNASQYMY
jgi:hypothetical protein